MKKNLHCLKKNWKLFKKHLINFNFLIISIAFSASNCSDKKENCFYTSGQTISQRIPLENFKYVYLEDNIDYYLIQDTSNWIELTCDEKTLPFINIQVSANELKINNFATCDFLRNYETNNKAIIHYKTIEKINFTGSKKITSLDTLKSDILAVYLLKGAGSIQLSIDCNRFETSSNGYGDLTIEGNCNSYLVVQRRISTYNLLNLKTKDSIRTIQQSINQMKIDANGCALRGKIEKSGDIYYKGYPTNIDIELLNKGKLISLN